MAQRIGSRVSQLRAHAVLTAATVGLFMATGCTPTQSAAAKQDKVTPTTGVADLPSFRDPASIRPADQSVAAAPLPPLHIEPRPAAPAPSITAGGPWAPSAKARSWRYIVLHHSASMSGNATLFDREHKAKGWDELGYHFVINNGRGGPDGQIEVGPRWRTQKWGAHAKTADNKFNDYGIGICFVGNFEESRPTARQLAAAARLVGWLESNYRIPAGNVIGHEDTGKQTLCPGKNLSVVKVRDLAGHAIADGSVAQPWPDTVEALADDFLPSATPSVVVSALIESAPAQIELMQSR